MTTESPEYANSPNHDRDGDDLIVPLFDANQGKIPRDGGPYLDEIEREQAELLRARRENRSPDLDNPPASAGTVLVTKSQLTERSTDKSHYADTLEVVNEPVASYKADLTDNFKGDPDPTQPDFNNDMSRVEALAAGQRLQELKDNAKPAEKSEPVTEDAPGDQTGAPVTDASKPNDPNEIPDPNDPSTDEFKV